MKMVLKVSSIATFSFCFLVFLPFIGFLGFAKGNDENHNNHDVFDISRVLISGKVVVSKDGSGNFTSINQAVAAAPNNSDGKNGYFLIDIKEGEYEEYVSIPKKKSYLMMVGQGIGRTIITGNHNYADGWKTFDSQTFAVTAMGFLAIDITFKNTAGPSKEQAVALRNGADKSTFYRCSFDGFQDTLYVHTGRQFYRECDIYGTVDFIFGKDSSVVLQNCNIYPHLPPHRVNTITAHQGITGSRKSGISIHNCTIKPADDLVSSIGTVKTYLGRPWKEYSRTVVMQSFLDGFIDSAGWSKWNESPLVSKLYYAEYDNRGPGANTSNRVTWPGYHVMDSAHAAGFTVANFLQGNDWLPQTKVPYSLGLI